MSAAIEALILRKLANGPLYARTFHTVKPVVDRLVKQGRVLRVAPVGGKAKNMLELPRAVIGRNNPTGQVAREETRAAALSDRIAGDADLIDGGPQ